jgi:predicted site-specific integrase-resolvase
MPNLWPDFDIGQAPRSPKTVIEEVGSGLEEKTNGLVQFYRMNIKIKDNQVEAVFSLYSRPLLYHFPFLRAKFAVEPVYPVTVTADKLPEVVVNNEDELTASLGQIFNAPTTVETIQRLMSLAQQ